MTLLKKIEAFLFPCTQRIDQIVDANKKACQRTTRAVQENAHIVVAAVKGQHYGQ